jgi:hypothetical protein
MTLKQEIFSNKRKLKRLEEKRKVVYRRFLFTGHYKSKEKLTKVISDLTDLQNLQSSLRKQLKNFNSYGNNSSIS